MFELRRRRDSSDLIQMLLEDGELITMEGRTQELFVHQVPKVYSKSHPKIDLNHPRINITFRLLRKRKFPTTNPAQTKLAMVRNPVPAHPLAHVPLQRTKLRPVRTPAPAPEPSQSIVPSEDKASSNKKSLLSNFSKMSLGAMMSQLDKKALIGSTTPLK